MIKKGTPMKGKPLVSAIIVGHNEEKYIGKAIKSLIEQQYKPLEIIVVDNNSSDSTFEIMKSYEKKHPKLIRAFQLKKDQKGPGIAWNHGVKYSKGKILMTFGGDLIFGKNYIKDLIKPILEGKTIGTLHDEEKIINLDNLWARAFCKRRICTPRGTSPTFSLIRKDAFLKYGPFDSGLGYADDHTIFRKHGFESLGVKTEIWHHNPSSFSETWKHDIWIGKSNPHPWKILIVLPVFPVYSVYKTLYHLVKKDFYWKFIFFLPAFYTLRYFGYVVGSIKRLFNLPTD